MYFDWLYTHLLTNKMVRNKRDIVRNEANNDLKSEIEAIVNRCLEVMAIILPKLDMVGVKLQVIEVKKLEFYIDFKKYSMEQSNNFEQTYNQQLSKWNQQLSRAVLAVFEREFEKFKYSTRDVLPLTIILWKSGKKF